ncbi:MAG: hypothetical protein QXX30_03025 [Candidatus Aenigmatarchaeota archaeon]
MRYETVTTYMLVSFLMFIVAIGLLSDHIFKSFQRINKSLIAYSDCSIEIIDSAFLGEFKSFSECYSNKLNNTYFSCIYENDKIICDINNETKIFYLR